MELLWISKARFYWQIEKSIGRNGQKSCNENVPKNTLFVAVLFSTSNTYNKYIGLKHDQAFQIPQSPMSAYWRFSGKSAKGRRSWVVAAFGNENAGW
jgi:hypothetical protein